MTIIAGLDVSLTSTGATKFYLDDNFKVIKSTYLGFTDVKKHQSDSIVYYNKKQFTSKLHRISWMVPIILDFLKDVEIVSIEGYSFASKGTVFDIGEFTGALKLNIYNDFKDIRIYEPSVIKKYFTKNGKSDKIAMYDAYLALECPYKHDLKHLPEVIKGDGTKPTSDLIDSFAACDLLYQEILVRNGIKQIKDYNKETIEVFNSVDSDQVNLVTRDFIRRST